MTEHENEPSVKQPLKAPKYPEFVDTHSHDSDDDGPHHLWVYQR